MNRTNEFISPEPDELNKNTHCQQVKQLRFLLPACIKIGAHGLLFRIFIWVFLIQPLSLLFSEASHFSTSLAFAFVLYAVTCFWPGVPFICADVKRSFSALDYQQHRKINLLACVLSWLEEALFSLLLPLLGYIPFWVYCHVIIPYLIAGLTVGTFLPLCLLPHRFLGGDRPELDY